MHPSYKATSETYDIFVNSFLATNMKVCNIVTELTCNNAKPNHSYKITSEQLRKCASLYLSANIKVCMVTTGQSCTRIINMRGTKQPTILLSDDAPTDHPWTTEILMVKTLLYKEKSVKSNHSI